MNIGDRIVVRDDADGSGSPYQGAIGTIREVIPRRWGSDVFIVELDEPWCAQVKELGLCAIDLYPDEFRPLLRN